MGAPRGYSLDEITSGKADADTAAATATPTDRGLTLDQVLATPPPEQKAWSNVGGDEPGGEVKNLKTSATKGILGIAGFGKDMEDLAERIKAGVQSIPALWNPQAPDTKTILARNKAAEEKKQTEQPARIAAMEKPWWVTQGTWDRMQKEIREKGKLPTPISNMASTEGLYKHYVEPHVGEYVPQTEAGKIGSAAVQAGASFLTPAGKGQLAERIIEKAPGVFERMGVSVPKALEQPARFAQTFKPNLRAGVIGTGSSVASERTGHYFPDNPNLPLIAGFGGPAAAEGVLWGGKRYIGPQTKEGQYRKAAGQMAEDIKKSDQGPDPVGTARARAEETYENLPEWQKGDKNIQPGIAEASQSPGLALSELTAQQDAGAGAQLRTKKAARDAAHEEVLSEQGGEAAAGDKVKEGFTQQAQALEDQINKALPDVGTAETVGAGVRGKLQQARTIAENLRTQLYDHLEKTFGDQVLQIPAVKQTAVDLMKHMEGFETEKASNPAIELALKMPGEVSFSQLRVYMKDLNKKIDDLRNTPGGGTERGRLEKLRAAVWDDLHGAVRNRLESEFGAEPRGTNAEAAFQAQLERETRDFQAGRGTEPKAPMGLPAIQALKDANAAQKALGQTFREGTVGELLKTERFGQAWNVKDSQVPRKAFPGGPDGYTVTKSVLDASPETLPVVKQAAIMSLREEMAKAQGVLSPKALETWRTKYAKSLTAIDEAEVAAGRPKFSDQFNNLSNSQSKLASDFIGAGSVEQARDIVGNMLSNPASGPTKLANLIKEAGSQGPMVSEGLKRLVVDHIIGDAKGPLGNTGDFAQRAAKALQENKPALRQLFGPEHLEVMESLINDAISQREHNKRMAPGVANSDTARRTKLLTERMADKGSMTMRDVLQQAGFGGIGSGLMLLGGAGPGLSTVATGLGLGIGSLILSRLRARGINGTNDAYRAGLVDPQLGMRMLQFAHEVEGSPAWWRNFDIAVRMSPYFTPFGTQAARDKLDEHARKGRAAGGKVGGCDHGACAAKLVRRADKIRRQHGAHTRQLLAVPDNVVADALARAHRGL